MIRLYGRHAGVVLAAALLAAPTLNAQTAPIRVNEDTECGGWSNDSDRYCEEREFHLDAADRLRVDAGANGGIDVVGWDRDEVQLIARIQASSRRGDARDLASEIDIRTEGVIEAEGPRSRRNDHWSVSFELWVPRHTALRLEANNGGIELMELEGEVEARTTNGGIHVTGGAGRIHGRTTNGGVDIHLVGGRWDGAGVDLQTTNGGVEIVVPEGYSADLETGTTNGGMRLDIPIMVQGRIDRVIRTQLGDGGPRIRVMTTNGGVVVRR